MLFVDAANAVGGFYTKKNLWTFLGCMPFYVMGGAVVNYALTDTDGAIVTAGALRVYGGYAKIHRVPDLVTAGVPEVPWWSVTRRGPGEPRPRASMACAARFARSEAGLRSDEAALP